MKEETKSMLIGVLIALIIVACLIAIVVYYYQSPEDRRGNISVTIDNKYDAIDIYFTTPEGKLISLRIQNITKFNSRADAVLEIRLNEDEGYIYPKRIFPNELYLYIEGAHYIIDEIY